MLNCRVFHLFVLALSYTSVAVAHSWVEQLNVIAQNGTIIDPAGFPRGNVKRTSPDFSDPKMVFLIPPGGGATEISASQLMCKDTQVNQVQTDGSPRLQAFPGASIALRYQENGHVSLPANQPGKPPNRGTNFVYFTSDSKPDDKFLAIHRVWNVEGNGGDGRGRLISTRDFDDSQCYQINSGPISDERQQEYSHTGDSLQGADLWCQQDIQIPLDANPGSTVTLYWVWDWPTMPGTPGFPNGKQEIYTTCMDIDIVAKKAVSNKAISAGYVKQNIAQAAVPAQFSDIANPTAVTSPDFIPFANAVASSSAVPTPTTSAVPTSMSTQTKKPCPHSSSTTEDYDETVTVIETVTATSEGMSTAAESKLATVTDPSQLTIIPVSTTPLPIVTVTEDDRVTVVVTNTVVEDRPSPSSGSTSFPNKVVLASVTSPSATGGISTQSQKACSTTAAPYRLRARVPFYILPGHNQGAGC